MADAFVHRRRCRTTIVRTGVAAVAGALLALGSLSCGAVADAITGVRGGTGAVSVDLSPAVIALDEGKAAQLTAFARDARGARMDGQAITWAVGDTAIAAVSMAGQVAARRGGVTTVTATADDGAHAIATLTVRGASGPHLLVSPASATLGRREFFYLSARLVDAAGNPLSGPPATYTSSNPGVATVNAYGTVEGVAEGSAAITVTSGQAVGTALVTVSDVRVASLTVALKNAGLRVGETEQAIVTARDSIGRIIPDRVALFGSTHPGAARVSVTGGLVTAVGPGKGKITAEIGAQHATAPFHVTLGPVDLLMLTPRKATIIAGQTVQLRSIAVDVGGYTIPSAVVSWGTSDHHVARVDSTGLVTGVSRGIAVIAATSEGKTGYMALSVLAPTEGNWARFDSDPGDWVGQGDTYSYTSETATITAQAKGVKFDAFVAGGEGWDGYMSVPQSLGRLQPGTYTRLTRTDFSDPAIGGIAWSLDSRGCNETTGWVTIDSVRYAFDQLAALDFHFEQHCDGGPALRGAIHWRPSEPPKPPLPPGPLVPIPTDLWSPPAGATPALGNWAYFKSDKGDWVGQGQAYLYTAPPAAIDVNTGAAVMSAGHAAIRISQPGAGWLGELQAPAGLRQLQVGYYPGVMRYLFHDPVRGGMEWDGNHNGCNELSGWFVIDAIGYDDAGRITALDARFEQHCENQLPALHGAIHWRAADVPPAAGVASAPRT